MKQLITSFIIIFTLASCNKAKVDKKPSKNDNQMISNIKKDINKTVIDAYKAWSFDNADELDFEEIRSYFTSTATIQTAANGELSIVSLEDAILSFQKSISEGNLTLMEEFEIAGETEYFGGIAHRISYHAYYFNTKDSIGARAVNTLQLVKIKGKWLINTVLREFESEVLKFPEEYNNIQNEMLKN